MYYKQGMALLLLLASISASSEEITYLVSSQTLDRGVIYGAAFTDSNIVDVSGFVKLGIDSFANFEGEWTRAGNIQAVDHLGNMYLFDVLHAINNPSAAEFAQNY